MSDRPTFRKGDAEVDALKVHLGFELDGELADHYGVDPTAITRWRQNGVPPARLRQANLPADSRNSTRRPMNERPVGFSYRWDFTLTELRNFLVGEDGTSVTADQLRVLFPHGLGAPPGPYTDETAGELERKKERG